MQEARYARLLLCSGKNVFPHTLISQMCPTVFQGSAWSLGHFSFTGLTSLQPGPSLTLSCASSHPHQPLMALCLVAQGACHCWGTCLFPQLQSLLYSSFYKFILITSWMTHSHLVPVFSHSGAPHEAGMLSITSSHTSL